MYDIAIVGAGPAGSTLARLISDKYKVLLIDKRKLTTASETPSLVKCCGGLLAPDAQVMLSRMGLGLPKSVLTEPQLFVVRAIDTRRRMEKYYRRYYINMDRQRFDCWLLSMVPPHVEIRLGCQFESYVDKAKILIGADGASSLIRRQAVSKYHPPRPYFAIQEWVEADNTKSPYFSTLFDSEITNYYCWTIPKGNYLIIGAALLPKDKASGKFTLLKEKLKDYGFRLGKPIKREGSLIMRPVRLGQLSTGTKGIALIGEAGGWISPSSAEGISYAFRSALILAGVLNRSLENFERRYLKKTRPLRRNIFCKNMKSHFIFNSRLRKLVMKSSLQSMDLYKP
jgi:flavin-dependent dehydrogenase